MTIWRNVLPLADCQALIDLCEPRPEDDEAPPVEQWRIADLVVPDLLLANLTTNWPVSLSGAIVLRYLPGGEAQWHEDLCEVAFTLLLNDGFTGGEFETMEGVADLRPGDLLRIDPDMGHQVMPVLSGERWSFVCWAG